MFIGFITLGFGHYISLGQYQRMKEEAEVLALIEQARTEVYEEQMTLKSEQAT
jgi:hypothetical protein